MNTLKGKITFFGIGISLLTSLIVGGFSIYQSYDFIYKSKINESENKVNIYSKGILSKIEELKSDVQFLASTPPVKGILRASLNGGIDRKDGSTDKIWKDRLEIIFKEMLYAKSKYIQIRYIGFENDGQELLRVDRHGLKVFRVQDSDLQKKAEELYFKQAIQTDPNRVYLSQFSLNREYGKVTYPHQLVLRAAVPIYKKAGEPFGIIIINVDYTSILKGVDIFSKEDNNFLVFTNENKILLNSENVFHTFESRSLEDAKDDLDIINKSLNSESLHVVKRVQYNNLNPSQYLAIYLSVRDNYFGNTLKSDLIGIVLLIFLLISFALFISIVFAKRLSRPINHLMELTNNISAGEEIDSIDSYVLQNDEIGKLTHTLVTMSQEIMQKNIQLEIQKSALDSSAIVAETDLEGKITYLNEKFIEISKYTRDELIGHDHRILNSGYHSKEFFHDLWSTISRGQIWNGEIKNKSKDGSIYWVDTTIYPVKDSKQKLQKFVAIKFDITNRKLIEEELKESNENLNQAFVQIKEQSKTLEIEREKNIGQAKLATLGQMAGGIAHEINNPLTTISMANLKIQKIVDRAQDTKIGPDISSSTAVINKTITRISNIIKGLQSISRDSSKDEITPSVLEKVIEDALSVSREKLKNSGVTLELSGNFDCNVNCVSGQISQIILNLISNSFDAIEGSEKPWIRIHHENLKDKHIISVIDSGSGVEKSEKIMNPFYTTKAVGKGTGLGLSISKSIAPFHNGELNYDANSVNTKFDLILPKIDQDTNKAA